MGWDIERFPEGEVNLELICCICTNILEDPVESPCRHVFCSQCIKTWLSNQKSCPNCRASVHKRDLQPVVPLLKNIISKQRIYCDNRERGCTEVVPLECFQSHVAACHYGFVSCPNDGCSVNVLRKDIKTHSENCLKRTISCEQGCEMFLKLGERSTHNCVQALRVHFQEFQNETMSRISKLEELVNMLVAKNGSNRDLRRSNETATTYNCEPYSIPSPHGYENRSSRYTVFGEDTHDFGSSLNLTEYSLGQNDLTNSIASLDSDSDVGETRDETRDQNDFIVRTRNRSNIGTPEHPLSPLYDHLERGQSSDRIYFNQDGRLLPREIRPRSRSPHSRVRPIRLNRVSENRQNRTYDRGTRRGVDHESVVLRMRLSQSATDSSNSSSSPSGSDRE